MVSTSEHIMNTSRRDLHQAETKQEDNNMMQVGAFRNQYLRQSTLLLVNHEAEYHCEDCVLQVAPQSGSLPEQGYCNTSIQQRALLGCCFSSVVSISNKCPRYMKLSFLHQKFVVMPARAHTFNVH